MAIEKMHRTLQAFSRTKVVIFKSRIIFKSRKDNRQEINPASFFSPKSKTPKKEIGSEKSKPETKKRKASDNDDKPNKKPKTVNILA